MTLPPPTVPFPPRNEVSIESYKFRAAVVDFTDQTGRAGDLVKTIPDILTTALFKSGRIDLHEREALRGLSPQDANKQVQSLMEKRLIDGVISGTITRFTGSKKIVVVELRLLSRNKAVMYADAHTLSFQGRRVMEVKRSDVVALAKTISEAIRVQIKRKRLVNPVRPELQIGPGHGSTDQPERIIIMIGLSFRTGLTSLFLFICTLIVSGCSSMTLPPPTVPFPPRNEVSIESYKFRAAVVDFTDQTGRAGDLVKTIPDILTTALFKSGRIDLHEREALRGLSPQDANKQVQSLMEKRLIDGVISGTITRFTGSKKIVVVELRLLSRNKAVMYADAHTLSFQGRRVMEVKRSDVVVLARTISEAIPSVPDIKISSKSGTRITLSSGSNKGLIPGMIGYARASIDKVSDPNTGEMPRPAYVIVGEVVIDQVGKDSAIGRMIVGEDIRVEDSIRFK